MKLSDRVYFYMPDQKAENQINRGKYNCVEAINRAIIQHYGLDVSEDAKIQMAAFGGGIFMGDVCSLLIGGNAGLGAMYASDKPPHSNDQLKSVCKEWYNCFENEFREVRCNSIKPNSGGCTSLGIRAGQIFEKLIIEVKQ